MADAKRRGGGWIEKSLDEIVGKLDPDLPRTLQIEDQGRFAVGYYHQRALCQPQSEGTSDADADTATTT